MNPFIIPVEIKVRELDAKVLLALAACERGARVVLGDLREARLFGGAATQGAMLAKSVNSSNPEYHARLKRQGVRLLALDEEGLTYPNWNTYLQLNAPAAGVASVDRFLTWGQAQATLMAGSRGDLGVPIVVTGNPRFDLLRPDLRTFYAAERDAHRREHGDYVLVNTSFGAVVDVAGPEGMIDLLVRMGAVRTPEEIAYYQDYVAHSRLLVDAFVDLLGRMDREAGCRIILRPHPAEDLRFWGRVTRDLPNVRVRQDGPAAGWIYGCRLLVQKGCTTAIEALALDVPAVTFDGVRSDQFDLDLPRQLSRCVDDPDAVVALIKQPPAADPAALALARQHIANLEGPLAADRVTDQWEALGSGPSTPMPAPSPALFRHERWERKLKKPLRRILPGYRESYVREVHADHKFPGLTTDELGDRVARLRAVTGRFDRMQWRRIPGTRALFEIWQSA